jgi:hypothetical protein
MDKENLTWRTFADPSGAISEKWGAGPANYYLLDHKGTIRHRPSNSSEKEIGAAIEAMIREVVEHVQKAPK